MAAVSRYRTGEHERQDFVWTGATDDLCLLCDSDSDTESFDDKSITIVIDSDDEGICAEVDGDDKSLSESDEQSTLLAADEKLSLTPSVQMNRLPLNGLEGVTFRVKPLGVCAQDVETTKKTTNGTFYSVSLPDVLRCQFCDETFMHPADLEKHLRRHHGDSSYVCETYQNRELHKKARRDPEQYVCMYCKQSFDWCSYLQCHLETHLHESQLYKRSSCSEETFSTSAETKNHVRSSTRDNQHKCSSCLQIFRTPGELWLHKSRIHLKAYRCRLCRKTFRTFGFLRWHSAAVHSGTAVHSGSGSHRYRICDENFRMFDSLKINAEDQIGAHVCQCHICLKTFENQSELKKHVRSHSRSKLYNCRNCNKTFATPTNFQKHVDIRKCHERWTYKRTVSMESFQNNNDVENQAKIVFVDRISAEVCKKTSAHECALCGKVFPSLRSLESHARVHAFWSNWTPSTSEDSHRAEPRSHKCSKCDKTFETLYDLRRHMEEEWYVQSQSSRVKYVQQSTCSSQDLVSSDDAGVKGRRRELRSDKGQDDDAVRVKQGVHLKNSVNELQLQKGDPGSYKCSNCVKTFGTLYDLRRHLVEEWLVQYQSSKVEDIRQSSSQDLVSSDDARVKGHRRARRSDKGQDDGAVCLNRDVHLKTPVKCFNCEKTFGMLSALRRHLLEEWLFQYQSSKVNYVRQSSSQDVVSSDDAVVEVHRRELQCDKGQDDYPVRLNRGVNLQTPFNESQLQGEPESHKCSNCEITFGTLYELRRHMEEEWYVRSQLSPAKIVRQTTWQDFFRSVGGDSRKQCNNGLLGKPTTSSDPGRVLGEDKNGKAGSVMSSPAKQPRLITEKVMDATTDEQVHPISFPTSDDSVHPTSWLCFTSGLSADLTLPTQDFFSRADHCEDVLEALFDLADTQNALWQTVLR